MDNPGRMGVHPWAHFDSKHNLQDYSAIKVMEMMQERDAAFAERDMALVEKKTAFAERESAFLQRDVAVADRNVAWMEREAAVMALSMVRAGKDNREVAAKLMQMANMAAASLSAMGPNLQNLSKTNLEVDHQIKELGKKTSPRKPKVSAMPSHNTKSESVTFSKKKQKQSVEQGGAAMSDKHLNGEGIAKNSDNRVFFNDLGGNPPIPHCSCTGADQQCYRWGKGGWQSACCTNFLSMYPLPMNPVKRSSRVPGRKMSGSAFKKLLERLAGDGVDISVSIDLKNYWAKHGTNRYATIK